MQNIYTIKARLAELREELMNHAAAWSDIPGGADNPIAQAEYARIWKISIHAPRVGGATRHHPFRILVYRLFQSMPPVRGATRMAFFQGPMDLISIHAPRAGGDC